MIVNVWLQHCDHRSMALLKAVDRSDERSGAAGRVFFVSACPGPASHWARQGVERDGPKMRS